MNDLPQVLRYLTHPQVQIEPDIPVPEWELSDIGRKRINALSAVKIFERTSKIFSSSETKAIQTAQILSASFGIPAVYCNGMHENDRSSTGFLPAAEFEEMADAFFANPDTSIRGWETARAAQARIVGEVQRALCEHGKNDILFVGHGAVGTLLLCHYGNFPIDRQRDQPGGGGGNYFSVDLDTGNLLHEWKPIEELLNQGNPL